MKKLGAAATLGLIAATLGSAPAQSQSGGSMAAASNVRTVGTAPRAPGAAFGNFGRYEPGNFPVPGLSAPYERSGRTGFFRYRDGKPDRPIRPVRPDAPDRPRHRDKDRQGFDYGYGYGIGYSGISDPDRGYFRSGGERRRGRDGRVRYDYDRGYPYDHYRPREERQTAFQAPARESFCEVRMVRGGSSGERVPVRICRN